MSNVIHGTCGLLSPSSPSKKDEKCSKKYPRALLKDTVTNYNGYPLYRRRVLVDGVHTKDVQICGNVEVIIDNSWVVQY